MLFRLLNFRLIRLLKLCNAYIKTIHTDGQYVYKLYVDRGLITYLDQSVVAGLERRDIISQVRGSKPPVYRYNRRL